MSPDITMNRQLVSNLFFFLALVFTVTLPSVSSIRVSQLMVPRQVGRGHDAQLHCHFNLGGNILYSVKWYKGSREFFRVVPDGARSFQVFPHLSNLTVDVQRSNITTVYLRNIQRSNAGTYRCEVSAEAPHFETDFREANMSVIDLPVQGPIIINVQTSYQPGERVQLNCTSSPSNPMAVLHWSLDGEKVSESHVKRYTDYTAWLKKSNENFSAGRRETRRETEVDTTADDNISILGLELAAELPKTITSGPFAVRQVSCTAFVGDIYRSVTHANLSIVDARSPTIRTPSHLLHSAASGTSKYEPGVLFAIVFQLILGTLTCALTM